VIIPLKIATDARALLVGNTPRVLEDLDGGCGGSCSHLPPPAGGSPGTNAAEGEENPGWPGGFEML
jgi:hypothetical protein